MIMELSLFGEKLSSKSGIRELMDDLSKALSGGTKQFMLGGGNPAHIPKIARLWERRMREILNRREAFEAMLMDYGSHRGQAVFLEALAGLLNREYGWDLTSKNIAVTNGSQNAFFLLFNMLSGIYRDGKRRRILFPLTPEYIGYADQSLDAENFTACRPDIEEMEDHVSKYHIDFSRLRLDDDIAGICVSRPTNPTGNVLTDTEIHRLADMAREREIPLLIDNAYGSPFPNIIFEAIHPVWNENIILVMSLSKLGLPAVRTGIVIAREEVVSAISAMNAVVSLSSGSIGQAVTFSMVWRKPGPTGMSVSA